jgi:hypothetical protein
MSGAGLKLIEVLESAQAHDTISIELYEGLLHAVSEPMIRDNDEAIIQKLFTLCWTIRPITKRNESSLNVDFALETKINSFWKSVRLMISLPELEEEIASAIPSFNEHFIETCRFP